jgi:hypothetical protein
LPIDGLLYHNSDVKSFFLEIIGRNSVKQTFGIGKDTGHGSHISIDSAGAAIFQPVFDVWNNRFAAFLSLPTN